jgi:hypothetical protein
MIDTLFAVALAVATGVVAAGIASTAYGAITNRDLGLGLAPDDLKRPSRIVLLVIAGPLLVMRHTWSAAIVGLRPLHWVVLPTALAAAWSFCLGLALLNLAAAV